MRATVRKTRFSCFEPSECPVYQDPLGTNIRELEGTRTVFPADKLDLYANGEGSAGKTGRYVYFILEKESEHTANKKVRKRISFAPF
jgi:hypothetical protein